MTEVTLYGAAYSAYVRMARLALEEKGVAYELVEVDVFAEGGPPAEHLARQPFGKIPAFDHAGFALYETAAITHYIDEAFEGPPLLPADARGRARANQIVGLLDAQAYRTCVWEVYVERVGVPEEGGTSDEATVARGLKTAETCLTALEDLMGDGPLFLGADVSLADLHAYPIFHYFRLAPEGAAAFGRHPKLSTWWEAMSERPSVAATAP